MNTKQKTISIHPVADTQIIYRHDEGSGAVSLELVPLDKVSDVVPPRDGLGGEPFIRDGNPPARIVDSLVQLKLLGDDYSSVFAQGHSMRNSPSNDRFKYVCQHVNEKEGGKQVVTTLRSKEGLQVEHSLSWHEGDEAFKVETSFFNDSPAPVTLEMLSSFNLSNITPFHEADAPNRLRIHRFRSQWSAEGRLETRTVEELHLERSWSNSGIASERFGQIGSMPVRKWFPFVAVEDVVAGVTWAAQLGWAGSWQMEVFRKYDDVSLSGGLADREFGHWMRKVLPGEKLIAPAAYVTCVHGGLDEACDRLTSIQHHAADLHPDVEKELPIIFNEWCTTWGNPEHEKVLSIARKLKGTDVQYFVIDAGWYKMEGTEWCNGHGDWNPSKKLFPDGLKATADAIRECGLIPGLWFEMETCGSSSEAAKLAEHLLQRDGIPIAVSNRRFWNHWDPWVYDYLQHKVIDLLDACQFGYMKVDYNETIGIGCDHPDSLGEGLRRQTEGTYRLFETIRKRLPNLVIENCASGGHRLEPSMMALTSMASFSDAHELVEIPIIAANLHRLILPRQSQIWAVLQPTDSDRRLVYSLAATFLGRMCLSGEITELSEAQWGIVCRSMKFYRQVAPIIKYGTSRIFGELGQSWRHPQGWQALRRVARDGKSMLVVIHSFAQSPKAIEVPLPDGAWQIVGEFSEARATTQVNKLTCSLDGDFSAHVVHLKLA